MKYIKQRKTNTAWFTLYVASKKYMNKQTKNRIIDVETKVARREEVGDG